MQTFFDSYRFRFVLANLVAKNFKTMYRNMALGFFWSILNPLVLVTVLSVVWVVFFRAAADFPSFVITALVPYNFFTYCVSACTHAISGNRNLVKKVAFPRQILPFSVILTHLIHLAIQVPLLVLVLVVFPPPGGVSILGLQLLWLPAILAVHLGLVVGLGLLVSGLNVVYRDVQYIVDSALMVLFWASPILYSAHDVLAQRPLLFGLYYLNPLAGILEAYRSVLYFGAPPHLDSLGLAVLVTLMLGVWGVRSFWIHEKEFADLV